MVINSETHTVFMDASFLKLLLCNLSHMQDPGSIELLVRADMHMTPQSAVTKGLLLTTFYSNAELLCIFLFQTDI